MDFRASIEEIKRRHDEEVKKEIDKNSELKASRDQEIRSGVDGLQMHVVPVLDSARFTLIASDMDMVVEEDFIPDQPGRKPRIIATIGSPLKKNGQRQRSKPLIITPVDGKFEIGISNGPFKKVDKILVISNSQDVKDNLEGALAALTREVLEDFRTFTDI